MEPTTQWKFRWFWPWQDDREEAWLGNLSREGWHLSKFGFPRIYLFQKGDPKNFVYRLDYQTSRMKDREAYLQLFRDAGWEPVGKLAAWEYFRKETADGEAPEIFTDPESKIRKYNCRRYCGIWGYRCRALSQDKAVTEQSAEIGHDSRRRQSRSFHLI
jgi:hypothetical protein